MAFTDRYDLQTKAYMEAPWCPQAPMRMPSRRHASWSPIRPAASRVVLSRAVEDRVTWEEVEAHCEDLENANFIITEVDLTAAIARDSFSYEFLVERSCEPTSMDIKVLRQQRQKVVAAETREPLKPEGGKAHRREHHNQPSPTALAGWLCHCEPPKVPGLGPFVQSTTGPLPRPTSLSDLVKAFPTDSPHTPDHLSRSAKAVLKSSRETPDSRRMRSSASRESTNSLPAGSQSSSSGSQSSSWGSQSISSGSLSSSSGSSFAHSGESHANLLVGFYIGSNGREQIPRASAWAASVAKNSTSAPRRGAHQLALRTSNSLPDGEPGYPSPSSSCSNCLKSSGPEEGLDIADPVLNRSATLPLPTGWPTNLTSLPPVRPHPPLAVPRTLGSSSFVSSRRKSKSMPLNASAKERILLHKAHSTPTGEPPSLPTLAGTKSAPRRGEKINSLNGTDPTFDRSTTLPLPAGRIHSTVTAQERERLRSAWQRSLTFIRRRRSPVNVPCAPTPDGPSGCWSDLRQTFNLQPNS